MSISQIHRFLSDSRQMLLVAMTAVVLFASAVHAEEESLQEAAETPHQIIELVTAELFETVTKYNGGTKDQEAFFAEVERTLTPVVDFKFIARVVMGAQGKEATDEQIKRFADVFKAGLVKTYAQGIAGYVDSDIKIIPPEGDVSEERRVSVRQQVRHEGATHQLSYTMAQRNPGEWKLINLVLDGVNLGRSFRSQFAQAAQKYDGDLDKVINNWLDEV